MMSDDNRWHRKKASKWRDQEHVHKDQSTGHRREYYIPEPGEVGSSGPQKSINGWILFVTGLNEETREDDVQDRFSEFGTVKSVQLPLDRRTGFCKGYSLVEFNSYTAAQDAVNALHTTKFMGKTIRVDWAFVKPVSVSSSINVCDLHDGMGSHFDRIEKRSKLR